MRDTPTLRPCPLCEQCAECRGRRTVVCQACPAKHIVDCTGCQVCGLCGGTHMVTQEIRAEWLAEHRPPTKAT